MDDKQKYALIVNEFMKHRVSGEFSDLGYPIKELIRVQLLNRISDKLGYNAGGGLGIYVAALLCDINMDIFISNLFNAIDMANFNNLPSVNECIAWQLEERAKREAHAKTIEVMNSKPELDDG